MKETPYLLIATAEIPDGIFEKAVVLVIDHSPTGAVGFIINKPSQIRLKDGVTVQTGLPTSISDTMVWIGGPVDAEERAIVIYDRSITSSDDANPRSDPPMELTDRLRLSSAMKLFFDAVLKLEERGKSESIPKLFKFIIGYAGWGEGQLDQEIMRGNWISLPLDEDLILDLDFDSVWAKALLRQGVSPIGASQSESHLPN